MISDQPTQQQVDAMHRYFAQEFPSYSQQSWWDEDIRAQVFALNNGDILRRVVIDGSVFSDCPDCVVTLRISDLADYMREMRAPRRGFHVTWQGRTLHIRSKAL